MIELLNMDCMDYMAKCPDKAFDLAIVDPPYGVNADIGIQKNNGKFGYKKHKATNWDAAIPNAHYFKELFRISKNQIICGGNYFAKYLPSTMGWIFWYKMQDNFSFGDGEFIFTSFQLKAKIFKYARGNESGFSPMGNFGSNIHPTQKPIKLYNWLLKNYAKEGDKIIDTHLGSGSSAIAALRRGFDFVGIELDPDYFKAAQKRFNEQSAQMPIFPFNND